MSIKEIIDNPLSISSLMLLKNGEEVIIRPLLPLDSNVLGIFLENLSSETKKKFQPHPLTMAYANELCSHIDYEKALRMVALSQGKIISYFILEFSFPEERKRYLMYGVALAENLDGKIAPVVDDKYQNSGIGSLVMVKTISIAKELGLRYIILSGGTQATNERAIHFYEKFGFQKVGEFEENIMNNYDMLLKL